MPERVERHGGIATQDRGHDCVYFGAGLPPPTEASRPRCATAVVRRILIPWGAGLLGQHIGEAIDRSAALKSPTGHASGGRRNG